MVKTRKNASDTDNPDSGLPVAGLPAVDHGITDDNLACNMDNDNDKLITRIVPLRTNVTHCDICRIKNILQGFLNLKDLIYHYKEQHNDVDIMLKCNACCKIFPGLKNWNGHRPKCKGPQQTIERPFKYSECELSFDTQIGLSQHERHAHPKTRNCKRKEKAEKPHGTPGRRKYVWTQEETNMLRRLNERYKDARFPNKELQRCFPDKTLKQISDKRRCVYDRESRNIESLHDPLPKTSTCSDIINVVESRALEKAPEPNV